MGCNNKRPIGQVAQGFVVVFFSRGAANTRIILPNYLAISVAQFDTACRMEKGEKRKKKQ